MVIISIGIWVSIASTPAVAVRLGFGPFYFVKHHIMFVPIALVFVVLLSFFQTKHIRKASIIGYVLFMILIICTLIFGTEVKGARRWVGLFGFSIQPSEFIKPILVIITAWLISEQYRDRKFPGILLSMLGIGLVAGLLLLQPDVGMTLVISLTWMSQLFISGLSILMICFAGAAAISAIFILYFLLPHVANRIDAFMMGDSTDSMYQIKRSLEAFKSGGFFGKGPGEGVVKTLVPDAHSDFVFSVIGEEFGFVLCSVIITLFVTIIIRSLIKIMDSSSIFSFSAVFGLVFQMAIQVFINLATALAIIPTKGMTLPFISYGGSSIIASSISIGILLAITKKNSIHKEM
jgi:cell division protein FtsW